MLAPAAGRTPREALPLLAVNGEAREAGIGSGWALNRALVRCPDLEILSAAPEAETTLRRDMLHLGESLTPDLELVASDTVILDLSRLARPGFDFLARLELPDADLWHAGATTPDLAHLAARNAATQGRIVKPADLKALPLSLLEPICQDRSPLAILELWGVRTLGGFMALPRQALIERLGPEAGCWHDLLHGDFCRLLRLHRPPESLAQRLDFEDAAFSLEPLVFAIKRVLHTLAGRLASRHLAAARLHLRLILDSGGAVARSIRLADPQAAVEGMLGPLQTWLDSLRLDAPVMALELDAESTFATAAQREWFGRQLPEPERWVETLAKLEALLGPGRVGIPVPPESHAPDGFTLHPAAANVALPERLAPLACAVPLCRYRPPRPIAVAFEWEEGRRVPLALLNGPHPGEIVDRRGPFPISGDWWEPSTHWQRLEWDVQVASRQLLRLVFQPPDRWQLEGIYR